MTTPVKNIKLCGESLVFKWTTKKVPLTNEPTPYCQQSAAVEVAWLFGDTGVVVVVGFA